MLSRGEYIISPTMIHEIGSQYFRNPHVTVEVSAFEVPMQLMTTEEFLVWIDKELTTETD